MRERNHWKFEPGAEVYGSPSIFHAPLGERNSPKFSPALRPTPAPRCGKSYGHRNILKSFSGVRLGPASSRTQLRPPSVRIFAAMPPPAPEPIMQTSYCFGERITWAILKNSPCKLTCGKIQQRAGRAPPLQIVLLELRNGEIASARGQRHVSERWIDAGRRHHACAIGHGQIFCVV